jgi:hypothetical protein
MLTCTDTYSLLAFAHLTMRLLRASCPPIVQAGILWQDFEPQCWQALDSIEIASVSASIRKPIRASANAASCGSNHVDFRMWPKTGSRIALLRLV